MGFATQKLFCNLINSFESCENRINKGDVQEGIYPATFVQVRNRTIRFLSALRVLKFKGLKQTLASLLYFTKNKS